ncbi:DUF4153 domain-containing protein [uncultured Ornithinimicrobium sp.]|uniref:DUF4153 domain-containing protein n=1 Tax=uncultured Ornithinimicrobium sp. TaxID=259307 RepID=UPI002598FEA9|nr:DUF4153 domain-containing protein [uncultured Ornithinimicrobium sp.]
MPAEQARTGPAPVTPGTAERAPGPLGGVGTVRTKIVLLVAGSVLAAVVVLEVGRGAGVPGWLTLPVTLAVALVVTQWLARGMTAPLRAMTEAADRMAAGDYSTVVTATGHDEVTRLADAFTRMAGDLDRADTTRRQLLETVSHELRTPLAAQRALLENLVDGVVQPDDAALQGALAQAERLSDLVTDLLDLTRLESGAVPLVLTHTSAADLLNQAVAEAGLGARDVQHRTVVTPTDLEVLVDPARMSQVVGNLLDNASRHSPTGGTVTLHVRGPGETGTSPDGSEDPVPMDRWRLEVVDEGPGIPPDRAEAVFTRYGRGDDRGGGTGLGLAIARWICELHGGSVSAHPRPDGRPGACLRVELPVRPPSGRPVRSGVDGSTERPSTGAATPGPVAVPVADGPAAHAVDPIFGRLWPPERVPAAPVQLVGAVGIGAFAALVLPDHDAGLGLLTVLLAGGALVLWSSVRRRAAWTVVSALLSVGLGALVVLRAADWLPVLVLLVVSLLVTTALTGARRLGALLLGPPAWVLSAVRGLPLLQRTLATTRGHRLLWPVVRTVVLSAVALVVFGGLFASGDAVFGAWVDRLLPDVDLVLADTLVLRAFLWFFVAGVVLAGTYLALNPPPVERAAGPSPRTVTRPWEWAVPVGAVVAVLLGFLVAQASAMWGGHDFVRRSTGLTYAEYVHQGFAQLTVATALTLGTIGLAVRVAPRRTRGDRILLRGLLGTLGVLTLVVVASALFRMAVYQEAYGYTVTRVLVDLFELWLGLVVVMVLVAGIRLSGRWVPRAALLAGASMLLVLGVADPEARVAGANIERFEQTGRLDLVYLASLGPDATPVIAERLPDDLAACVLANLRHDTDPDPLWGWNLGRARAAEAVPAGSDAQSPPEEGGQGCLRVIGEDGR